MDRSLPPPEALDACAERLEQLNRRFPNLASEVSREGVTRWRQARLDSAAESVEPQATGLDASHKALVLALLQVHSLEEVLAILTDEHGIECRLPQLVELIGPAEYARVLLQEARQLAENSISYDQIAGLWNDLDRPALGADRWSGQNVSVLFA